MENINLVKKADLKPKIRVLFIITRSEYGGAQRFLHQLISRLDRTKYEITVLTGIFSGQDFLINYFSRTGINVLSVKSFKRVINPFFDIIATKKIRNLIKLLRPDILFLNSSKAGFIGSLAARLSSSRNMKVIYRIGGWTFNDPWPRWKKTLFILLEKISAAWKDDIVVNSQYDFELAKRYGIKPRQNLLLIHNGLDPFRLEFFSRDEARVKLFEKISWRFGKIFQAKYIIGTIANLYPTKGIDNLIRAAAHLKDRDDLAYMVIGDGPERPRLEEAISLNGLEKKVFLVGQIPDAYQYLPAFDIFVLPSVKEGFPWSLLEAMAAKLPVVASSVGAVPEIVEHNKSGFLVTPGHWQGLAETIKTLLENEMSAKEMGIQGHQTLIHKFGSEKMINSFEELLSK